MPFLALAAGSGEALVCSPLGKHDDERPIAGALLVQNVLSCCPGVLLDLVVCGPSCECVVALALAFRLESSALGLLGLFLLGFVPYMAAYVRCAAPISKEGTDKRTSRWKFDPEEGSHFLTRHKQYPVLPSDVMSVQHARAFA